MSYKYKRNNMKNLITTLAILTITVSTVFATTTPEVLISSPEVEVVSVEHLDIFTNTAFDSTTENLTFDTKDDISIVQIFNSNGDMEFQLPVMSTNVQINKNLFDEGTYKLGFVLEGQTEVHITEVTIK